MGLAFCKCFCQRWLYLVQMRERHAFSSLLILAYINSSKAADFQSWGIIIITGCVNSSPGTSPVDSLFPQFSSTILFFHVWSSGIVPFLCILGRVPSSIMFQVDYHLPFCLPSLLHHGQSLANHSTQLIKHRLPTANTFNTNFFVWNSGLATIS